MSTITRRGLSTLLLGAASLATLGLAVTSGPAAAADAPKKIIFLVNGTLGDKSYFDLGAAGIAAIKAKYGDAVETKVLEIGNDQTKWQPAFEDVSEQDWDLIFACTYEISDIIAEVAPNHPDKTYAVIDAVVPFEEGTLGNVYAVSFKQNEGSYLAGILAAGLLKDGTIPADQGTSIGFLGGMDIPGINDFLTGYIEGAQSLKPDIKVAISYAGTFDDAAKGKELALAQYRSGTAIGFNVAGQTGLGQLAAAKEVGKWALGVNSDQEAIFRESDPAMADWVASSMVKKVDVSMLRAYDLYAEGKLPVGKVEALGLAEDAVGLVETGNMAKIASPELKQQIAAAKAGIIDGSIKVTSGFGLDTDKLNALRDSVRP